MFKLAHHAMAYVVAERAALERIVSLRHGGGVLTLATGHGSRVTSF